MADLRWEAEVAKAIGLLTNAMQRVANEMDDEDMLTVVGSIDLELILGGVTPIAPPEDAG